MKPPHIQVSKAAKHCGVDSETFKRWIRAKKGLASPQCTSGGRTTYIVPLSWVDEYIEEHSPRVPRVSGVMNCVEQTH